MTVKQWMTRIVQAWRPRWRAMGRHCFWLRLRRSVRRAPRHRPGIVRFDGYDVAYTDLLSFYMEYKDIFRQGIYHFGPQRADARIIDGGGCIGMSVLYFKSICPGARVTCFEPDADLLSVLRRNMQVNGLRDVEIVPAGLAGRAGRLRFRPDGVDGGRVVEDGDGAACIDTVPLSRYLDEPVDLLKLNIEGQELAVLSEAEAAGRLGNVNQTIIEYHGWPGGPQCLDRILAILDRQGFRYVIHDFDGQTCGGSKPPFRVSEKTTWFCLIAAWRMDAAAESAEPARRAA
jgi:FkbM family methyltransferase